jgi:hypothetical protein
MRITIRPLQVVPARLPLPPHRRTAAPPRRQLRCCAAETVFGNQRRDQPSTLAQFGGLGLTRDRRGRWLTNRCGEACLPCPNLAQRFLAGGDALLRLASLVRCELRLAEKPCRRTTGPLSRARVGCEVTVARWTTTCLLLRVQPPCWRNSATRSPVPHRVRTRWP